MLSSLCPLEWWCFVPSSLVVVFTLWLSQLHRVIHISDLHHGNQGRDTAPPPKRGEKENTATQRGRGEKAPPIKRSREKPNTTYMSQGKSDTTRKEVTQGNGDNRTTSKKNENAAQEDLKQPHHGIRWKNVHIRNQNVSLRVFFTDMCMLGGSQ